MRDARATETVRIEKVRDLSMRLTCPRCGAQYEIAAAAIPAAGREVECSACSHVWFQPGQPKAAAPYDPEARPALNRPLNESILAILRDETARELQARQVDAGKPAPGADQNIANAAAETPPEQAISAPGPSGITETVPAAEEPADEAPAEPVPASTDIPVMADADWPATTLTTAPAGPVAPLAPTAAPDPEPEPEPEPVEPVAEPLPPPASTAPEPSEPAPAFKAPDAAPDPVTEEDAHPEPVVAALPDAAELAATLTRPGPPPALAPFHAPAMPDAAEPASAGPAPDAAAVLAPLAVVATAKRGSGYASGFGLAAMLALGLVAVYALAPRVTADEDGGLLAEWRQEIDRGRLWLHDRIIGE